MKIPRDKKHGSTTITWDAGKDHPNAVVRVKIQGGEEKIVAGGGKGSVETKVKPGRNVFILTDSGERLASVVVEGRNR